VAYLRDAVDRLIVCYSASVDSEFTNHLKTPSTFRCR
jgi:hypothetical protein